MVDDSDFFRFARERQAMLLRRRAGLPAPWTQDPILASWRFCCVRREDDRTTVWFRENVRDRLRDQPEVMLATVLFRWFNRISTGEAIFRQESLGLDDERPGETAWDTLLRTGSIDAVRAAVLQYCSPGPYVTGAYIVKTPDGMDKVDGVLWCVSQFARGDWRHRASHLLNGGGQSLRMVWEWLRGHPYMGDFMAYEVVTDLRHTALLEHATDVDDWANPGPGAARGLARLRSGSPGDSASREEMLGEMRWLLQQSRSSEFWPQWDATSQTHVSQSGLPVIEGYYPQTAPNPWPVWEMREVEHVLCEFDKMCRIQEGGRGKRRYP